VTAAGGCAVVTGASRGLGREIARQLAAAGYVVVGLARSAAGLEVTAAQIRAAGGNCATVEADVRDAESVERAIGRVADDYGPVEVLVNNAGLCVRGELDAVPAQEYADLVAVNALGTLSCTRAVWPLMRKNGGGAIVNISSLATAYLTREFAAYAATKGFVETLTLATAQEGRRLGIRSYAIAAGYIRTDLMAATSPEIDPAKVLDPADVAALVLELLSPRYLRSSGTILRVSP
jgi:NAD(P)-dependent dehydrogenase (short-subunit alcohol dehydrogenase family)